MSSTTPAASSSTISTVALERELSQLTNINSILQHFLETVRKVNGDLSTMCNATTNSRILMSKWTDIMSQTDFTLDAINNNAWDPRELNGEEGSDEEEKGAEKEEEEEDERTLVERLRRVEQENTELSKTIENIAREKNARMNKRKGDPVYSNNRRKLQK
ncbi:hypothetical protein Cantr_02308 [Candida viswanathii]|uniref:DASH complex subunit DUO1 n=1 Tax=Candida viswanathii TaxID=5486 RepID=A0A367YNV7_9ASCO|nr:hypothetical protein Cantr_02308 [Candida viswanathii]